MVHPLVVAFRALAGRGEVPSPSASLAAELVVHGLAPYAFSRFGDGWRPLLRSALAETFAASEARRPHLQRAIAALGDIQAIALKGLDYASSIYTDPALRPMGDHDLLVRDEDYPRALSTLVAAGFREALPQVGVARHPLHYATQMLCAGYALDLHRAVRQAVRADVEYASVFASAAPRADGLLTADPRHRVLLHVMHMAGHEFCGPLVRFLDLTLMPIDDATRELAKRWHVAHPLQAALRLRALLLGERAPHAFTGQSLLPSLARLCDPAHKQRRPVQLARKLVLLDDWRHRFAFARYALAAPRK